MTWLLKDLKSDGIKKIGDQAFSLSKKLECPTGKGYALVKLAQEYLTRKTQYASRYLAIADSIAIKGLLLEMKEEISRGRFENVTALADDVIANEEKVSHHGRRADAIVKGMLQHSRQGGGEKEMTNINQLADEYLRLSYQGVRAKDKSFNTKLETNYDENLKKIEINRQDVGRVLLNVYNNAFYAVGQRAKIQAEGYHPLVAISTHKKNGRLFIKVKDNGNGIPEQIAGKIFQPFFTTKPSGQGTGLGLSLSYDIIKADDDDNINMETKKMKGALLLLKYQVECKVLQVLKSHPWN